MYVNFFNTLKQNGWLPNYEDKYQTEETYSVYELTLIGKNYNCRCFAHIAAREDSIDISGYLGVAWIEVEYENRSPYGYIDLEDMQEGINCAEKNLLTIGVPFQADTVFHGTQAEIKAKNKLNTKLRKKWNLDEIEKAMWEKKQGS